MCFDQIIKAKYRIHTEKNINSCHMPIYDIIIYPKYLIFGQYTWSL